MFKSQFRKKGLFALITLFLLALCVGIFALFSVKSNVSAAEDAEYDSVSVEDKTISFTYGERYNIGGSPYTIGNNSSALYPDNALSYFKSLDSWQSTYGIGYTTKLEKFTYFSGNEVSGGEAEYLTISQSGTYEITVKSENEDVTDTYYVTVKPREINLNGIGDIPEFVIANSSTGTVTGGSALSGDHTTIYKTNTAWYAVQSADEDTVDSKTVTNSYVYGDTYEKSVMISGENFTEADTSHSTLDLDGNTLNITSRKGITYTASGEYVASFVFSVSDTNNYVFNYAEGANLSDTYKGLEIKNATGSSFTLTKHWYILETGGLIIVKDSVTHEPYAPIKTADGNSAIYTLNYNDPFTLVQPGFYDQNDQGSSLQSVSSEFSIVYLPEGASKAVTVRPRTTLNTDNSPANENYLAYYINSSMPAGTYTLTIYAQYTAQINSVSTTKNISGEYTFNVLPKSLDGAASAIESIKTSINGENKFAYSYPVTQIHNDINATDLLSVFAQDRKRAGSTSNYWATDDAAKYFATNVKDITLLYYLDGESVFEFVSLDTIKKSLVKDGEYTFYYSISAKNYTTVGGAGDSNYKDYSFNTNLYTSTNGWNIVPTMQSWSYGLFNKDINIITASLKNSAGVTVYYRIGSQNNPDPQNVKSTWTLDGGYYWLEVGNSTSIKGSAADSTYFTVDGDGKVSLANVQALLAKLDAGTYYLGSYVTGNGSNVNAFETTVCSTVVISKLQNFWTTSPYLSRWTYGSFSSTTDFKAGIDALNGTITYTLKNSDSSVNLTFTSENGSVVDFNIDEEFNKLGIGEYTFTAHRDEDAKNYTELNFTFTVNVDIAANEWMPSARISSWEYGKFVSGTSGNFTAARAKFNTNNILYTVQKVNGDTTNNVPNFINLSSTQLEDKLNTLGVGEYNLSVKVSGTNFSSLESNLRFSVTRISYEWDKKPAASAIWTWGEIKDDGAIAKNSNLYSIIYPTVKDAIGSYTIQYTITGTGTYETVTVTVPEDESSTKRDAKDLIKKFQALVDIGTIYSVTIEVSAPDDNYNSLTYSSDVRVNLVQNDWIENNTRSRYEADYDKKYEITITAAKAKAGEVKFYSDSDLRVEIPNIDKWVSDCKAGDFKIYMAVVAAEGKYTELKHEITVVINGAPSSWGDSGSFDTSTSGSEKSYDYTEDWTSILSSITLPQGKKEAEGDTTTYTITFRNYNNGYVNSYTANSEGDAKFWITSNCKNAGSVEIVVVYQPADTSFERLTYTIKLIVARRKLVLQTEYAQSATGSYGNVGIADPSFTNADGDYDVASMVTFTVKDHSGQPVANPGKLSLSAFINKLNANASDAQNYTVSIVIGGNDKYEGFTVDFTLHINKAENTWATDDNIGGVAVDWLTGYTWTFTRLEEDFASIIVPKATFGNDNMQITLDGKVISSCTNTQQLIAYLKQNKNTVLNAGTHTLNFRIIGNSNYGDRSSTCQIIIEKAQNSWSPTTEALGHTITRTYGADLTDLRFTPLSYGLESDVVITINGSLVTDIAAYVRTNGANTYTLVATLAENDDYATLTYTISLTITKASNSWGTSQEERPHFSGAEARYDSQTGKVYYIWEYSTPVTPVAKSTFGDLVVEYYKATNARAGRGEKLNGMPADVGSYIAVFLIKSDNGGYEELSEEIAFQITKKSLQEWTSEPYVAGWIWSAFNTQANNFTAIPESGGEISFEIYDSKGVKKIERFKVNSNGVPFDYYDPEVGMYSGDLLTELKNLIQGDYILWTYVSATDNYSEFIYKNTTFTVTLAQNSWITTPQIVAWSKSDYDANLNAPKARTYYGEALIKVTMNSTSTVLYEAVYNAIYDKNNPTYVAGISSDEFNDDGYKIIKDELDSAEPGFWYTLYVTVEGVENCYDALPAVELTFMVFDEGTSSNFWVNNPAIKGWIAGFDDDGVEIYELPTASAFRGKIYFEFYKDGDPTEPEYVIGESEDSKKVSKEDVYAKDFYVPTAPGRYYMYAYATTGSDDALLESSRIDFTIEYRSNSFDDSIDLLADTLYLGDYYAGVEGWGVPYAKARLSSADEIWYEFYTYNDDGTINSLGDTCPIKPGKYYVAAHASARYCEDIVRTKAFEVKLSTNRWENDTSPTIEGWSEEFNSTSPDPTGSVEGGKKITYYYIDNATGEILTEKPTAAGNYTLVARVEEDGYETLESRYEFTITPAFDTTLVLICTILALVGCAFTVVVIIFAIRRNREN